MIMYKMCSFNNSWIKRIRLEHTNLYRKAYGDISVVKDKCYKDFNKIPGPRSYPLIGTLHSYLPLFGEYKAEALHQNAMLNWKRYGPLVREALLPGATLLHVFDPDDIAAVFRQEGRLPARRSHLAMLRYRLGKPSVYNTGGLLATNGPDWWRLRSTFQKNFTSPQSVRYHISSTDNVVSEFIQWIKMKRTSHTEDFLMYLNRLNLEILGRVAFDERFDSFSDKEQLPDSRSSNIISAAFDSNSGVVKLDKGFAWKIFNTPLYSKLVKSQSYLESVSMQIMLRKANFFGNIPENGYRSLLDSFLQQPNVDLKDIIGIMVDILMAAIDTTSYSLSFALYHLALNPECQQGIYNEARMLLPDGAGTLTAEALAKASYTRSCIKESLRLNPVSIGVGRILHKEIVLKGYLIPKNTVIVTQNMIASRLPQFIKDPLKFNPKRWQRDSDAYENINPFLSLPFGFGPRSCIARRIAEQNICITLLRIIRDFELRWEGGELGIETHLINKPDQPIHLNLTPR